LTRGGHQLIRTRLGLIYVSGGGEQEYYQFAERHGLTVYLVVSKVGRGGHHVPGLLDVARIDSIVEAAKRLIPLRPDAVIWGCTSGSFILGRSGAEAQVQAVTDALNVPASSTSLAFIHALQHLNLRQVAVAATYPAEAAKAFASFLAEFGIECVNLMFLGAEDGRAVNEIPVDRLMSFICTADLPNAEAILVPDTALPSLTLIEPLEHALTKPILTANQVSLWEGLRLAGAEVVEPGYGRLFRTTK
jgi:maleate cis-trans isomerase